MPYWGGRETRYRWSAAAAAVLVAAAAAMCVEGGCRGSLPEPAKPGVRPTTQDTFHKRSKGAPASCPALEKDRIYRFITGVDTCASELRPSDVAAELHDAFAELLLKKNIFPGTATDIVKAIKQADPTLVEMDRQKSYVLGEGANIPVSAAIPREAERNLRYVLTFDDGADRLILVSAAASQTGFLAVISWDAVKKRFNFYDFDRPLRGWNWNGDSSWSRDPAVAGQGCFDCHHNGSVIMKELERSWNNWHSELSSIDPGVVPAAMAADPLFQQRKSAGNLESTIRGGVNRLYQAWLPTSGDVARVPDLLRHLTLNTTINLRSSPVKSREADDITIPSDFFLADDILKNTLQLSYAFPSGVKIRREAYGAFLKDHHFRLVQDAQTPYEWEGATHFALFGPAPSFEDRTATRLMTQKKIISAKFAASVLMVDFQNPVFSAKRASLQKYAEQIRAWSYDGRKSDLPAQFAAVVTAGASGPLPCADAAILSKGQSGEPGAIAAELAKLDRCPAPQQFLFYWGLDEGAWPIVIKAVVEAYLGAAAARIATPDGASDFLRLSVSRASALMHSNTLPALRERFAPISNLAEFSLLFPKTDLPDEPVLRMKIDGTVEPELP